MKSLFYVLTFSLALALTSCNQCQTGIFDTRKDLGKLTTITYAPSDSYCDYEITAFDDAQQAFYKVGDQICIRCCTGDKEWPPKNPTNQKKCYNLIEFTSSDGQVKYKARLTDKKQFNCKNCAEAKGYYECP